MTVSKVAENVEHLAEAGVEVVAVAGEVEVVLGVGEEGEAKVEEEEGEVGDRDMCRPTCHEYL